MRILIPLLCLLLPWIALATANIIDRSETVGAKKEMIRWGGTTDTHSRAIDILCDRSIKLVITLQAAGVHPRIGWNKTKIG
mgnify:CR=1 FL=1